MIIEAVQCEESGLRPGFSGYKSAGHKQMTTDTMTGTIQCESESCANRIENKNKNLSVLYARIDECQHWIQLQTKQKYLNLCMEVFIDEIQSKKRN